VRKRDRTTGQQPRKKERVEAERRFRSFLQRTVPGNFTSKTWLGARYMT